MLFGVGVDGLGSSGALLVDLLGIIGTHALTPVAHCRAVTFAWKMRISSVSLARLGHWRVDRRAMFGGMIDAPGANKN